MTVPVVKLIANVSDVCPSSKTSSAFTPSSASDAETVNTSVPAGDPSTTSNINGRRATGALSFTSISSMVITVEIWNENSPLSETVTNGMMVGVPFVAGSRSNSIKFRRTPLLSIENRF